MNDSHLLITIEPDKRSGQPCLRGLRMTVQDVLEYLASGMSVGEVLADFPDLTAEDIRASLAFAADREGQSRVLSEAEFWGHLEYRVCRELAAMTDKQLRRLWCDGFIPEQYILDDSRPRITGRAWIGSGTRDQSHWEFTLLLPQLAISPRELDWASLLPAENLIGWLAFDMRDRRIEIDPAIAVPDAVGC